MVISSTGMTFVLVHGAWHGGWCWSRVADILRSRGHKVSTPTLTGQGERSHLLSKYITLALYIDDIVNHLVWEDLQKVTLVGHSFGGIPITGAADSVPERISRLVFLDACIIKNGEAFFDLMPKEMAEARIAAAIEVNGCLTMTPHDAASYGITKAKDVTFVDERLTPHPLATYREALTLKGPVGNGLPVTYVSCTDPIYEPARTVHQRARDAGWPIYKLATGHDAMITDPGATADLLEEICTS
jgi:pimeloyl-ACP methyl ester carboxylesterase